ncbi:MAG TPA: glutathione transferase GstA [Burkholderiales bacterium]|nr:glutathione transferase GstA [Burkholderiales bacterium]
MKLYYSLGACSLVIRILIHELNLKCEFEEVNLKTKLTKNGMDFFQINPKGFVPALELISGEILTENVVIQQYLVDTNKAYNLLSPVKELSRYHILEWVTYINTELHKSFSPFFKPDIPAEIKEQIFKPILFKNFNYVEKSLNKKDYLLGANFTLPDIYLFVMIIWLKNKFPNDIEQWSNLNSFFDRLIKREAFKKALNEEGLLGKF